MFGTALLTSVVPPKVSPKPLGCDLGSKMTILGPRVTLDDPGGWYQVIEPVLAHYCSYTTKRMRVGLVWYGKG